MRADREPLLHRHPRQVRDKDPGVLRLCQRSFSPGGDAVLTGVLHAGRVRHAALPRPAHTRPVLPSTDQPLPPRRPPPPRPHAHGPVDAHARHGEAVWAAAHGRHLPRVGHGRQSRLCHLYPLPCRVGPGGSPIRRARLSHC